MCTELACQDWSLGPDSRRFLSLTCHDGDGGARAWWMEENSSARELYELMKPREVSGLGTRVSETPPTYLSPPSTISFGFSSVWLEMIARSSVYHVSKPESF
ncbi:hypothetical protein Mapa_011444 [Marchantia paleacea]|nr:hypothetical protein Mapa_011444 [Marchantia paleacea]